jgi:hypothetical protein
VQLLRDLAPLSLEQLRQVAGHAEATSAD